MWKEIEGSLEISTEMIEYKSNRSLVDSVMAY